MGSISIRRKEICNIPFPPPGNKPKRGVELANNALEFAGKWGT